MECKKQQLRYYLKLKLDNSEKEEENVETHTEEGETNELLSD